jgi:dephospho-CoA kinase
MKDLYREVSDKLSSHEALNNSPLLVILVGESGVGKSTFCKALGCKDNWYVSSDPIIELVKSKELPVNHDTIHACACEAYAANPKWQVPLILESMNGKNFLLLDGPRRHEEVKTLKEQYPKTLVVRIIASEKERFARLQIRDGIDWDGFQRVLRDEAQQTELMQILGLSDMIIQNNGTIDQIQVKASDFKDFMESNGKKN